MHYPVFCISNLMNYKNPTIVIINGANWIGSKLVETLIENKGNVIVVDDFNESSMAFIKHFSDDKRFVFIEKDKVKTLRESFSKIKYIIHLKNDSNYKNDDISSKQFLNETRFIDEVLNIANEKQSAYILTSSIHLHKDFVLRKNFTRSGRNIAYTESDLQDYLEKIVLEYHHKAGLNSRVARLGNVYGPGMDLSKDEKLLQIISDAFYRDEIRIYGDGLEFMYYIYITDAVQGILSALFSNNTAGQVFSLTNPEEISVLSIVNKILALQPKAKKIKFLKGDPNSNPLYERAYIPDSNLSELGWKPVMSFERGLVLVFEYFKNYILRYGEYNPSDVDYDGYQNESNDLEIDLDHTINLADSFYGANYENSTQFRDFQKKLYSQNSPIYNIARKTEQKDPHPYLKPPKNNFKKFFISSLKLFLIVSVFVFVIIPGFRIGLFSYNLNNKLDQFSSNLNEPGYENLLPDSSLNTELSDSLITINWIIDSTDFRDMRSDYENLIRGYDKSVEVYNIIVEKKLQIPLQSTSRIDDVTLGEIRNLLPQVEEAIFLIEDYREANISNSQKAKFNQILIWLQTVRAQAAAKFSGEL